MDREATEDCIKLTHYAGWSCRSHGLVATLLCFLRREDKFKVEVLPVFLLRIALP